MKRRHDLSGMMKLAAQPDWADHLRKALDDQLGPSMKETSGSPSAVALSIMTVSGLNI